MMVAPSWSVLMWSITLKSLRVCGLSMAEIIMWSVYKLNVAIYSSCCCGFTCGIAEVQTYLCSPKFTHNHLIIKQLWGKTRQRNGVLLVVAASELALPCLNRLSQWYYMWRSTWSLPEGFQLLDHPKAAVLHKDSPFIHSFVRSVFHRMTVKFVLFVGPRWV